MTPVEMIETCPTLAVRIAEDRMFFFVATEEPPYHAEIMVTHELCPELGPEQMGFRFNGKFEYMDNPFWLGDMFFDDDHPTHRIGGAMAHNPEE